MFQFITKTKQLKIVKRNIHGKLFESRKFKEIPKIISVKKMRLVFS